MEFGEMKHDGEKAKCGDLGQAAVSGYDHDRLMTVSDVAKQLGICTRTVHRLVAAGDLPPPVKVGRASRWFISDVNSYLERLRQERTKHVDLDDSRRSHR